jgi:DNA-binding LytR/AlgR family response regulator
MAFKYNGIDYILKPPSSRDIAEALRRARSLAATSTPAHTLTDFGVAPGKSYRRRFLAESSVGVNRVIDAANVALFRIEYGQVGLVTFDGFTASVKESLDRLEAELDPRIFFRANRQYIVNVNAIEATVMLWTRKLRLALCSAVDCDDEIIVSRERIAPLRQWLKGR